MSDPLLYGCQGRVDMSKVSRDTLNDDTYPPTDISAKAALREILMVCDEAPTEVNAWVVEIQEICRRVLKTLPP